MTRRAVALQLPTSTWGAFKTGKTFLGGLNDLAGGGEEGISYFYRPNSSWAWKWCSLASSGVCYGRGEEKPGWYRAAEPFQQQGSLWPSGEESKYLPVLSPCADY